MIATFRSLAVPNYRRYAAGAVVSNTGTWMGRVAQDWLVLTELTQGSATALGTVTGLQFTPFLLLAPVAGAVADRYPKRLVMLVTQTVMAASALTLAGLTVTGAVRLWHVYVAALVQGIAAALDAPARQAMVSEVVDADLVSNAVALNSASFTGGRILGPAIAGLVISAWGTGWALLANGLSFGFVIAALLRLDVAALHPAPVARGRGRIREGVSYVRGRPDLMLVMVLVFVLGTFGMNFQVTIALMATAEFHRGPTEFGLLGSVMAVGSFCAALLSARRRRARLRVFLVALAGFVVASAAAALAPSYGVFALALLPVGLTALTAMTTANAYVQLGTEPGMRGRVMALYLAIFMGGTPLGAPLIGWLGDTAGPRWTIGVGSVAVGLALLMVAARLSVRENVRVRLDVHQRPMVRISHGDPEAVR